MAGFFGLFDYSREGPGVKKNAPRKNRFVVFFETYFAKFWKLVLVNLIYVAGLIPFGALSFLIFRLIPAKSVLSNFGFALSLLPFALTGPLTAGAVRLTRDFVRGEPVFLWSDFVSTVKRNWKESLLFSVLSHFFALIMSVALPFYLRATAAEGAMGFVSYLPLALCTFAAVLFVFMQYYIYLMQVTLDLSPRKILKNAAILGMAALFKNLLITLLIALATAGVLVLGFYSLQVTFLIPVTFLLVCTVYFSLILFIVSFIAFPVIQKLVIDPYYEAHPELTSAALEKPTDEAEEESETPERELPEYVYHNGRMVHRSVLEKESLFDDDPFSRISDDEEEEDE